MPLSNSNLGSVRLLYTSHIYSVIFSLLTLPRLFSRNSSKTTMSQKRKWHERPRDDGDLLRHQPVKMHAISIRSAESASLLRSSIYLFFKYHAGSFSAITHLVLLHSERVLVFLRSCQAVVVGSAGLGVVLMGTQLCSSPCEGQGSGGPDTKLTFPQHILTWQEHAQEPLHWHQVALQGGRGQECEAVR